MTYINCSLFDFWAKIVKIWGNRHICPWASDRQTWRAKEYLPRLPGKKLVTPGLLSSVQTSFIFFNVIYPSLTFYFFFHQDHFQLNNYWTVVLVYHNPSPPPIPLSWLRYLDYTKCTVNLTKSSIDFHNYSKLSCVFFYIIF